MNSNNKLEMIERVGGDNNSNNNMIESVKPKDSFIIKKKYVYVFSILIVLIFIGSILATYFGKPSTTILPETITTATTISPTIPPAKPVDYRLPNNLKPFLYDLTVRPYIGTEQLYGTKAFTFEGTMIMYFECSKETSKIVFHANELNIDQNKVVLIDLTKNSTIDVKTPFSYDDERLYFTVNSTAELISGHNYSLSVPFNGNISTNLYGFYRGSYVYEGKTYYLASTDFEPTDARRAFPCFDEPAMKSKFKLTMIRHKDFNTMSNSLLINTTDHTDQDWKIDYFDESVPMSTYLMAYVVSNFKKISTYSPKKNVTIEVAARPEAIENGDGDFALQEAAKIIDFFSDYFETDYPLKKSTQIAVPDFNSGAMENWGIVIYREASLLYNNKTDTITNKRRVSEVVSHELAHQWFGNLVTMKWWNDLWLNEGFASWVENLGYNFTHPEWKQLEYFFIGTIPVMVKDSYETSHPISVTVNDPKEIGSLFDAISYDKGASIIRMMNAFLTEKTFKKGVSNYLEKHKYNNAEQDDLWDALDKQAHSDKTLDENLSVKEIMDTWTVKMGYPVVNVTRNSKNKIKISQKWFLINPLSKVLNRKADYENTKWYIPFTYTTQQQNVFQFESKPEWLKPSDTEKEITLPDESDWIIGNLHHSGFYRVNYDDNNWNKLIEQLETDHTKILNINRATLLDDSFNLGRSGLIDQTKFFETVKYLSKEEDSLAFQAAFYGLDFINDIVSSNSETSALFKEFYINLIKNQYTKLGWNLTLGDANEIDLQIAVIRSMCKFGYDDCIQQSRKLYYSWINNNEELPSNFKSVIYQTVITFGDKNEWYELYNIALKTTNTAEKLRMLRALTSTKDYELLKFLLSQSTNETVVRKQDETTIVTDIGNNLVGRRLVFDYLDQKWDYFLEKYGGVSFTLSNLVSRTLSKLNTGFELEKLKRFQQDHQNLGIAASSFKEVIETVATNVKWIDTNLNSATKWLVDYKNNSSLNTNEYRLPNNLVPSDYVLFIQPNFTLTTKPEKFNANIKITFKCISDTNKLVLHAEELTFDKSTLILSSSDDSNFAQIKGFDYSINTQTNLLTASLSQSFKKDKVYDLYVEYEGKYFTDNLGFYSNSYNNDKNETNWMVSSQFEPVKARRAMPCFDEPAFKSTFKLKVKHHKSLRAISNMPSISVTPMGDWIQTEFNQTLKMSTYLVALVVADYECIDNQIDMPVSKTKLSSSTCARSNAVNQINLASNSSISLVQYFEKYFDTTYPFPKLDHIGSPDFAYGAMENWGLAIYKESSFLFTPGATSQTAEQAIVRVVAHEISHQWFGNLVTPKWWDDLWLNEGFARYMEYLGTDSVQPDWQVFDQYMNLIAGVFHADSEEQIRSLSPGIVNTPAEIDAMVDGTITYGKGSAVVRMLTYILGQKTFNQALTAYFDKFKYQNVDQYDLWTALKDQSEKDKIPIPSNLNLTEAMRQWTKQSGHPLVSVNKINNTHISIKQQRFVLNSTTPYEALNDKKWYIPFSYTVETVGSNNQLSNQVNTANIYDKIEWLQPVDGEKVIELKKALTNDSFLLGNLDASGYFRVNYDLENWNNIISQLNKDSSQVSLKMRAQLINDAFGLSQATQIGADLPLKLIAHLETNADYLPWNVFISRSKFYLDMLDHTKYGVSIQDYMAKLSKTYYLKFNNWYGNDTTGEKWVDRIIKTSFISFSCLRGLKECTDQAKEFFDKSKSAKDLTLIPSLFRQTVYCVGISHGTIDDFNFLLEEYDKLNIKTDRDNKTNILFGLSCSKDISLLNLYLSKVEKETDIDFLIQAIRFIATKPNGYSLAWNYVKTNWDSLYNKSKGGSLNSLINDITNKFNSQEQYDDFVSFFARKIKTKVENGIETARLRVKSYVNWFKKSQNDLDNYFK